MHWKVTKEKSVSASLPLEPYPFSSNYFILSEASVRQSYVSQLRPSWSSSQLNHLPSLLTIYASNVGSHLTVNTYTLACAKKPHEWHSPFSSKCLLLPNSEIILINYNDPWCSFHCVFLGYRNVIRPLWWRGNVLSRRERYSVASLTTRLSMGTSLLGSLTWAVRFKL